MNVLTGYTKGTLSDNYLLSAAGGHIPLGNSSGSVPLSNNTLNTDLFAEKAALDGDGNTISSTYLKKGEGATGVQDYGSTTDRIIKIGYSGTAATTATHFAVYQDDGTKIKDMSVANVKTLLNIPTKVSLLTNDLTYLTRYGEGSKASVRTADRTVALCTGGWSGTETDFYGYGARYGTTLDISGFSTWYHRLAFATTGRIQYWLGINTKTLTHAGNIAFTYDIPTKVSLLTNDSNYATVSSTLGKSSIGIPNGSIVKVTVPSNSHYLITLRGTQGQRCALLYVSGYGSGGTSTRLTVRVIYSHSNFEYYYNEESDSIGGIYVKNAFTGSAQNDTICVTSLNKSDIPTLTTVTTIPTGANKINSAECNLLTVDTADNYFVRNTGSLKNPNAIKFKNTAGTVVSYDGSTAVDLTGGVNNAKQLNGNAETSYLRARGLIAREYVDLTTYTSGAAAYKNYDNGIYDVEESGSSSLLIHFGNSNGSSSALEFWTQYPHNSRIKVRKTIDSNRVSGAWKELAWYSDIPTALKNPNKLTFAAGTFAAKTYDGSAAVTVNIPTHTSHLTNNSGFLTSRGYIGNTAVQKTSAILALTGISGITFSGGNEYFDQYGNFHFGTEGTTWGIYHNDSSVLLKLTKSTGLVEAKRFKVTGGTYSQFLKADGSIDSNTYLTASSSIPDTSITWSSTGLSGYTGPVSTALCGPLKGNRFAGIKADAIRIEYSTDGGTTWLDYETPTTDAERTNYGFKKQHFFTQFAQTFVLGKNTDKTTSNNGYRLRATVDCNVGLVYTELKKAIIYVSSNGASDCKVSVQTSNDNITYTERGLYGLIGWSGYNEIPLVGITADPLARGGNYARYIRFDFSEKYAAQEANNHGLCVMGIEVFGGVGWTLPNNHIARYGRPYTYNCAALVQFFNTIYPESNKVIDLGTSGKKWRNVYAVNFTGNVTGNVTGSATSVIDFGNGTSAIKIGYAGAALTTTEHFAAYSTTSDGTRCIKDISVATVKTVLNVPDNTTAHISAKAFGSDLRYIDKTTDLDTLSYGMYASYDNYDYTNGPTYNFGLMVMRINSGYTGLLAFGYGSSNLMYRSKSWDADGGATWKDWLTIAYMTDIPTKVSQLTNDNNYISLSGVTKLNSFYSQRPTTPDTQYTDNALRYYLAAGLMTTNKPASDGYILQFSWDNSGYNSWLFIPSGSGSNSKIQYRTTVGSSYNQIGSWVDVLDSNMLLTATDKTNLGWSSATANKLIPTIGTLAYWTGAYNGTHNSNLQYCVNGEIIGTTNYTTYTVKKDGTGASGTWGINVTGSSGSCTGNAATATCIKKPSSPVTALPTNTTTLTAGITMGIANSATTNKPTNTTYGNVIQIGGQGHAQLFMEWSGSSTPTTGKVYYNSKRDIESTAWGGWVQLIDERDVVTTSKAGLMSAADKTKLDSITGSVTNNLVIKLNNGTAEGTNLFTFNGSAAKTINITPASINALASNGTASAAIRLSSKGDNTNANTLCFYSASISSTTLSAMNSWTRPTDGSNNAMVLRMYKTANTGHDIYAASDKDSLWHRNSSNATSKWAKILDSLNCYGVYKIYGKATYTSISCNNIEFSHGKNILNLTSKGGFLGDGRYPYLEPEEDTFFNYDSDKAYFIISNPIMVNATNIYFAYTFVGKLTSTRLLLYVDGAQINNNATSGDFVTELFIFEL